MGRPRRTIEHTCTEDDRIDGCQCAAIARRRQRNGNVRAANLWRFYRIRLEDYEAMRVAQDYRCAICGRHEDEIPQSRAGRPRKDGSPTTPAMKLVVDHCHTTGKVRELLCQGCNQAIGGILENPVALQRAIAYLERHRGELTVS